MFFFYSGYGFFGIGLLNFLFISIMVVMFVGGVLIVMIL